MLDATKNYFTNESTHIVRSQEMWTDLGYSLSIPWNAIYSTAWQDAKPGHADGPVWGSERQLITRPDPEFFASDGVIRSNVLPNINVNDPIYSFDRRKYTFTV